jgi:hypothetical protein
MHQGLNTCCIHAVQLVNESDHPGQVFPDLRLFSGAEGKPRKIGQFVYQGIGYFHTYTYLAKIAEDSVPSSFFDEWKPGIPWGETAFFPG